MIKKMAFIIFLLAALLFLTNCTNLLIETDVDYPSARFEDAAKKIQALHAKDPLRKGPVNQLNFLVYAGDERKLVQFSIKKEMAKTALSEAGNIAADEIKKYTEKCKDVNLEKFKDFDRLGPGLLAEIKVDDENTHVLIWLD
jgi:hypothetical protein